MTRLRRAACRGALALLAVMWPAAALAQQPTLAPSEALECLTPAAAERGLPAYDPALIRLKTGGTVRIQLTFERPDAEPSMRLLDPEVAAGLVDAVREHVRGFRVPCLPSIGGPVRMLQEYVFRPDDGRPVRAGRLVDEAEARRLELLKCVGRDDRLRRPEYPARALQMSKRPSFLVRASFSGPDDAPAMTFLAGPDDVEFRRSLRRFLEGYRMPCHDGGMPVAADFVFKYKIVGEPVLLVRDMSLVELIKAAAGYDTPAAFDLNQMGCPFDVRITHHRPWSRNHVGEVGARDERRRPLLQWLGTIGLRLPEDQLLAILGDPFTVSVPCGRIDL